MTCFYNAMCGVIDAIAGARIECIVMARHVEGHNDLQPVSYDRRKLPVPHLLYGEAFETDFVAYVWFGYDDALANATADEPDLWKQMVLPF